VVKPILSKDAGYERKQEAQADTFYRGREANWNNVGHISLPILSGRFR
jgi:hypothetical protein